jgi:uncharacterized protein (TIGR02270 family)
MAALVLDIVAQHAEEAAFLWHLRDLAVDRPHYATRHLLRLEERLEAHLDGLAEAGATGLELAQAQLDRHPEPGEAFVLALLLLEARAGDRLAALLELAAVAPATRRGLAGALGWIEPHGLQGLVGPWLGSAEPLERWLGLVACSLHRVDPGGRLRALLDDPDPLVRARVARLAGELGRQDLRRALEAGLDDPDPEVRLRRAGAAVRLGGRGAALEALAALARTAEPDGWPALDLAVRAMPVAEAAGWIRALNGEPHEARRVIRALAALGDPVVVPWLLARMDEPAPARLAGEALALITGVDLAFEDLDRPPPEDAPAGPSDSPAEEDVALDPDEHLPWPDRERVEAWWAREGGRFARGTRHLLGRPVDADACERAWTLGFQRQRRAAALELALLEPATPLRSWRARLVRRTRRAVREPAG